MKNFIVLICFASFLLIISCEKGYIREDPSKSSTDTTSTQIPDNGSTHEDSTDYLVNTSGIVHIVLDGTSITSDSATAVVSGNKVTITAPGTYSISGTLTNGQVIVSSSTEGSVKLIFNGASITNTTSAPVYIKEASKVIVMVAENTDNSLTDAVTYVYENAGDNEPNAALFSKTDLTVYGSGTLNVKANYNDGITSKDGLIIKEASLNITSADDGIRGKDYLVVESGNITINSKGDGLKSDNDEDVSKGYISISTGVFNITSVGDAIQAETNVSITGGEFTIVSGGGSSQSLVSDASAKGIKAGTGVYITGESFSINTADDAVHSNKDIVIGGGTFNILTGDDGMHADSTLTINDGVIAIAKCYEGIESAVITINNGNIHVTSSDDGLNGAGGSDGSVGGWPGGPGPGQSGTSTTAKYFLYMNGGYVYVDAQGDGVDINGSIVMTGGNLIVNGPTANDNGALDYDNSFKLTGGYIVAAGSSGMAMIPDNTSSQNSVLINFSSTIPASTLVHIQTSTGTEIVTFKPTKKYQSLAFSSPGLVSGTTYEVYYGGSSTGTVTDGLYTDGTYTPGTKYKSFTISGVATKVQ